jgi:lipoate-protein ligase A
LHSLVILHSGLGEPAYNMALDEALLENAIRLDAGILRFYGWTVPAATFGYFQHYADVEKAADLRPLIRRPTGGGIVPHDRDWTYSAVFPPGHPWYSISATESYRQMHEWIQRAFGRMSIATDIAACCLKSGPGQCFVGYEKFDLLWHGKKVAGAAQRRTKAGLLIQGSVQPPPIPLTRAEWEAAMLASNPKNANAEAKFFRLDDQLRGRAEQLAREKYSQSPYNRKR